MKRNILALVAVATLLAVVSSGCGKSVYTKGKYVDPGRVDLLSDKFVESDLQIIADTLTESLLASELMATQSKKPAIILSLFTNGTDEHIDMISLTGKMKTDLVKARRFRFLNKRLRKEMAKEYEYQGSGYVDPETAKMKGKQIGADWLISGHIASIRQPVGKKEIVYYKTTLEVTDLETSEILWADEVEIKKAFKRKKVRF
jgi:penicillin-binding protein activator